METWNDPVKMDKFSFNYAMTVASSYQSVRNLGTQVGKPSAPNISSSRSVQTKAPRWGANTRFTRSQWQAAGGHGTGQNYSTYQQNIDWTLEVDGLTNIQRAMNGNAPFIMKDGVALKLNLHHSRQDARGSLFEVSDITQRARRDAGGSALHPFGRNQHPDYPVNRPAFDVHRNQYWIDRATAAGGQ